MREGDEQNRVGQQGEKVGHLGAPVRRVHDEATGCCIQAFAPRMKSAERLVPSATIQIVTRCSRGDSLSRPNSHRPRKVDSMKKASRPSIARGAPKMSPTKRE